MVVLNMVMGPGRRGLGPQLSAWLVEAPVVPLPLLQGTFGELPQPASDQLGVVRSCAYHLLNMINQLRDCLRTLHEGDPELNAGRVQLSNAVEEVRGAGGRAWASFAYPYRGRMQREGRGRSIAMGVVCYGTSTCLAHRLGGG